MPAKSSRRARGKIVLSESASSVVDQLDEQGFAVVPGVLDPTEFLDPLLDEFAETLHEVVRAGAGRPAGGATRTYASSGFSQRLIRLLADGWTGLGSHLDISLPLGNVRPDSPILLGKACYGLLSAEPLLDVVASVIGPDIWLSPVGHSRMKVPVSLPGTANGQLGNVPWHQDNGVVLEEADAVDILTVWVAVTDATLENGCMQVVPSPRSELLHAHCPGGPGGLAIPPVEMPQRTPVPLPMPAGSVLFMHSRTVHSSRPNLSENQVRVSMDLRYQAVGEPSGRPAFPCFQLRDRRQPGQLVTSWEEWRDGWLAARRRIADRDLGRFNRWDSDAAVCA